MEDIVIPMLRGNMEDIAAEGGDTFDDSSVASSVNTTQQMYDRESRYDVHNFCVNAKLGSLAVNLKTTPFLFTRIQVDYRQLSDDYKDLDESDDIKKRGDKLQRAINSLMDTIQRIQAPNMKVGNQVATVINYVHFFQSCFGILECLCG